MMEGGSDVGLYLFMAFWSWGWGGVGGAIGKEGGTPALWQGWRPVS
jgi:hypothetical protein